MSKKRHNFLNNDLDINKLKYFYGIPHCHTNLSTGSATPTECLEIAYRNDLDFLILTDHNNDLSKTSKSKDNKNCKWSYLNKCIIKFNKKNPNFIGLAGFEAHSKSFGHFNIINPPTYFTGNIENISSLVLWGLTHSNTIISVNHPHKNIENIEYNTLFNSCIKNIEVANGILNKKYTKHDKFYYNLLDKGWQLGAINGQDNHKTNIGKEENLTVVIANSFSKESIIKAFKQHTVFSTESKTLKMYFTINSVFMGSTVNLELGDILDFYIYVEDPLRKISKVQIISNQTTIIKEFNNIDLHNIKFMYEKKSIQTELWYVIKIILSDKREALSSPIFLKF